MSWITEKVLGVACAVLVVLLLGAGFKVLSLESEVSDWKGQYNTEHANYGKAVSDGKAAAESAYSKGLGEVKDKEVRLAELTTQLEREREQRKNQDAADATAARARVAAAGGLRDPYASPARTCPSQASANGAATPAPGATGGEVPGKLSDRTAGRVFAYADEVEELNRNYATCKGYVERVRTILNTGADPYR